MLGFAQKALVLFINYKICPTLDSWVSDWRFIIRFVKIKVFNKILILIWLGFVSYVFLHIRTMSYICTYGLISHTKFQEMQVLFK